MLGSSKVRNTLPSGVYTRVQCAVHRWRFGRKSQDYIDWPKMFLCVWSGCIFHYSIVLIYTWAFAHYVLSMIMFILWVYCVKLRSKRHLQGETPDVWYLNADAGGLLVALCQNDVKPISQNLICNIWLLIPRIPSHINILNMSLWFDTVWWTLQNHDPPTAFAMPSLLAAVRKCHCDKEKMLSQPWTGMIS